MAFLSRTPLNPLRKSTQALVRNVQEMHVLVRGVVPPSATGRVLWRLEELDHHYDLYILSPELPSLEHLVERAGWLGPESGIPKIGDLEPLLREVAVGREFGFRVTLNPVVSTRSPLVKPTESQARILDEGTRAVRVAHRTVPHQMAWFTERTSPERATWGFEVEQTGIAPDVRISSRRRLRFRKPGGGAPVTLETVTYDGRLRVTDSEQFKHSLISGMGKGKAYGCGLLTLAAAK